MWLSFEKWHACKNDFIIFDLSPGQCRQLLPSIRERAPELCDRRTGIGADGILIIEDSRDEPSALHIVNADGTVAGTCGNGIRCAALFAHQRDQCTNTDKQTVREFYLNAKDYVSAQIFSSTRGEPYVIVQMGTAKKNRENKDFDAIDAFVLGIIKELKLQAHITSYSYVTLLNPHIVIRDDGLSSAQRQKLSQRLQDTPCGSGINVSIVREVPNSERAGPRQFAIAESYEAYVWERGVGESPACGSAACAIASVAQESAFLDKDGWIAVNFLGGTVLVRVGASDDDILLLGYAHPIFLGKLDF